MLSGEEEFYTRIIEPLGHKAKERSEKFKVEYDKVINRFTVEFSANYCKKNGEIDWDKLIQFNSGK